MPTTTRTIEVGLTAGQLLLKIVMIHISHQED